MYNYFPISDNIKGAEAAAKEPLVRYGVSIYVESEPDYCGPNFEIDPLDIKGHMIFQDFCNKIAEHYKSLK